MFEEGWLLGGRKGKGMGDFPFLFAILSDCTFKSLAEQ